MPRPTTYDHLKSSKKPNCKKIDICLDPEMADEFNELKQKLFVAKVRCESDSTPINRQDLSDIQDQYDNLLAAIEDQVVTFKFNGVGRKRYEKLVMAHAPTKAQLEKEGNDLAWNTDTFPVALVALSLAEPKLTQEEVQDLWDDDNWGTGETTELLQAAFEANANRPTVNLGKG